MNIRVIVLLVLALVAAAGTAQYVRTWLQAERSDLEDQQAQQQQPQPEITTQRVLVAAQDLSPGTILGPGDLSWEGWPEAQVKGGYVVQAKREQGLQDAVGGVIRQPLVAGTPIVEAMYVKPGDRGFLAAILKPGKRAVTIPVNNAAVLSGLVFPGDRVDIILSHTIPGQGQGDERLQASETVLPNVRVLALDQRLSNPDNQPEGAQTVTFEVTPKQAEQLAVAQQLGQLRLSLRSVADGKADSTRPPEMPSFTISSEVSRLLGRPSRRDPNRSEQSAPLEPFTVEVVRGAASQTRSFGGSPPEEEEEPDTQQEAAQR